MMLDPLLLVLNCTFCRHAFEFNCINWHKERSFLLYSVNYRKHAVSHKQQTRYGLLLHSIACTRLRFRLRLFLLWRLRLRLRLPRCALLLVVCCGVRFAAVYGGESRRAQRGRARTEYLLVISLFFLKRKVEQGKHKRKSCSKRESKRRSNKS